MCIISQQNLIEAKNSSVAHKCLCKGSPKTHSLASKILQNLTSTYLPRSCLHYSWHYSLELYTLSILKFLHFPNYELSQNSTCHYTSYSLLLECHFLIFFLWQFQALSQMPAPPRSLLRQV